ncbi:unnamed protein product [Allacma fusca]|uniref:Cyclin-dependent kinase 20 n=1 Tax=Allacma fusca TaxID=39272 RepID=A0A8J2LD22_9HEXA|nr:unnamed protein product [Allacma fusca]
MCVEILVLLTRTLTRHPLGEGAHGIVLKAQNTQSGGYVALKKVTLKKVNEEGIPLSVIREIKALQCIEHENIVYLIDVFPQGLSFVMVFEFMPSNLWEYVDSYKLSGAETKCLSLMLLEGLKYLHENHIMHRDLKPANLLISENRVLKIGDFGLCRLFFPDERVSYSHQVATRWYRSPELLYGARYYTESVDLWAAGCIIAEMLKGLPIFPGENDIDQLYKVISSLGTPDETIWPGRTELPDYNKISFVAMEAIPLDQLVPSDVPLATAFVSKFLLYDASKRISAEDALDDIFFQTEPLACECEHLPPLPPPKQMHFDNFDSHFQEGHHSFDTSSRPPSTVDSVTSY